MMSLSNAYSYIASQCRVADRNLREPQGFVTISRQTGAGGIAIGEKLAIYLDQHWPGVCSWTVFDKNLVDEIIKDHDSLKSTIAPFLQEKAVSEIEDMLEEMLGVHPAKSILVSDTNATILRLARMGRVILVGHGSANITNQIPGGVHVRLVGSFEKRKEYTKEYLKCDEKQAIDIIDKEDKGREEYLKQNFGQDIHDLLRYDVVINTDLVSFDQAASLIGALVIQKRGARQRSP